MSGPLDERLAGAPGGFFELRGYNLVPSRGFAATLAGAGVSLALTTGDRLLLVGVDAAGGLAVDDRALGSSAGLAAIGSQTLFVAGRWQLHRLENLLGQGRRGPAGHDRLYQEQTAATTGFIGVFDIAVGRDGRPLFVSALFNCVASTAPRADFLAQWLPPFVSELATGDRCHVTGLALDAGELAYVTCGSTSDTVGGWREHVAQGGVVVDVRVGRVLAEGLSLPHSPRLHEGVLYACSAGTGELVRLDRETGATEVVARVDGLARGLAFAGGLAFVGCSRSLEDGSGAVVAVAERVPRGEQRHAVAVVDLASGQVTETLDLLAGSGEVYAVATLPGAVRPGLAAAPGGSYEQLSVAPVEG